ncbi:anthranilate phosphoribosyltransferase [Colwellia sp. PAMC 21821]|uniref:anthranilate phosphoribosyltransferase n=1 Tax=Colwellia sp. PAMC 21821 TaxID=1816219 RepID=UPI0009BCAB35|nr:anthranilate phosphoribosyltransferase [Colwellia sp. PAMC 21821]
MKTTELSSKTSPLTQVEVNDDITHSALNTLVDGDSLTQQQSHDVFEQVINGFVAPERLAAILTALKIKGETPAEIAGAAIAIRENATPFPMQTNGVTDCVGTGGDGANTINISTTAAILAAACGIKMAKHGNRSVSSMSGSADLLEAFGVNLTMSPEVASECLAQANICFLYAPAYHTGFKHAAPVRKAMAIRTLFNILGPLVNPAKPDVMLLGVYLPELITPIAEALLLTGVKHAWVVHGSGLDEIALHGKTKVTEISNGELIKKDISPADFGLKNYTLEDIKGGTPQENAEFIKAILAGKGLEAHNSAVIINCAALLYLHREQLDGQADTLLLAAQHATKVLASGAATKTLADLVRLSNAGVSA